MTQRVTVLAGGVGGAKFVQGLRDALRGSGAKITVVVNTGDDLWLTGVRVCPDLDSMMYALAGVNDPERGWGRAGESERVSAELHAYGVGWPWFTLGDLDLGTHLARTSLLREGLPLSAVVERLCARWACFDGDPSIRLLPATDHEVETWVETDEGLLHFEEWWVRTRAKAPARRFVQRGAEQSFPAPGVVEALDSADVVLLAPSNPVVSLGPMLGFPGSDRHSGLPGIPGLREAVQQTSAPVVGVSPIIGGAPVRGMAAQCLAAVSQPCTAEGVGLAYGARSSAGVLDFWLVAEEDTAALDLLQSAGLTASAHPLWMTDPETTRALATTALRKGARL